MPGLVFYGMSDSTPAMRAVFARGLNGNRTGGSKRRTKARKARAVAKKAKRRTRTAGKPARLVKGSAAAKRYMAKLRAKANRKRRA